MDSFAHARNTDPESSREAAEEVNRGGLYETIKAAVLREIRAHPGLTSAEIGAAIAPEFNSTPALMRHPAARATAQLRNAGLVFNPLAKNGKEFKRKCNVVERTCMIWKPIPEVWPESFGELKQAEKQAAAEWPAKVRAAVRSAKEPHRRCYQTRHIKEQAGLGI